MVTHCLRQLVVLCGHTLSPVTGCTLWSYVDALHWPHIYKGPVSVNSREVFVAPPLPGGGGGCSLVARGGGAQCECKINQILLRERGGDIELRHSDPMVVYCWARVVDDGPALNQH